jgi:hypothetical protein
MSIEASFSSFLDFLKKSLFLSNTVLLFLNIYKAEILDFAHSKEPFTQNFNKNRNRNLQ